jgi:hypothetical protein
MNQRPRYPRTGCIVPFCRKTSTLFPGEWVCADHWRLVDRALKQIRARLIRRFKRRGWIDDRRRWPAVNQTLDGVWRRMKRQAIERAAGASA